MKIELESTTKIVSIQGVPCRVWEGKTESGVPMIAFIVRVAVKEGQPAGEFERELKECRTPSVDAASFPARLLID